MATTAEDDTVARLAVAVPGHRRRRTATPAAPWTYLVGDSTLHKVQELRKAAQGGLKQPAGNVFDRPVFARTRQLCLELPGSSEKIAWGHPTFKAGDKMFCAFEMIGGRPSIAFRLPSKEAAAALKDVRCFASPYGRGLWVSLWVDGVVDRKEIATFVERSYRTVATKRLLAALDAASS